MQPHWGGKNTFTSTYNVFGFATITQQFLQLIRRGKLVDLVGLALTGILYVIN
jgi:hypothetical protein